MQKQVSGVDPANPKNPRPKRSTLNECRTPTQVAGVDPAKMWPYGQFRSERMPVPFNPTVELYSQVFSCTGVLKVRSCTGLRVKGSGMRDEGWEFRGVEG